MKKLLLLFIALITAFSSISISAQDAKPIKPAVSIDKKKSDEKPIQHGRFFVDKNGDGYNDNAPDEDGDGIPNALDPDFKGPRRQKGKMGFTDLNGDGINDNGRMGAGKKGFGPVAGKGRGMETKNGLKAGDGLKEPVKKGKN